MTLDEKLQALRTATQSLEPSAALQAKLAATVDAGTLASTGAAATGAQAALPATVKVLFVTLVLGVVGTAFYALNRASFSPWQWAGAAQLMADAGTALSSRQCPAPTYVSGGKPIPEARVLAPWPGYAPEERETLKALRHELKSRPFTCTAQQTPLEQLLRMHVLSDAKETRILTRLAYLCPGAARPFLDTARWNSPRACDNSDWCHYPSCSSLEEESCAQRWAELPAESCGGQEGRQRLSLHLCNRLLRADIEEAAVRSATPDAWCLKADVLTELAKLREETQRSHHVQTDAGVVPARVPRGGPRDEK
ncbi:MAG: hypothetical protein K1X64_02790 [Myxococcaceae bacterium]|nr:hypothetical protein [Myxococcaceae bacterium]